MRSSTPSRRAAVRRTPSARRRASSRVRRSVPATARRRLRSPSARLVSVPVRRRRGRPAVGVEQVEGKARGLQLLGVLHQDPALEDVAQLAHVARPGVALERRQGVGMDRRHPLAEPGRQLAEKRLGQDRDVLPPLPQRRDAEGHDGDAVEEIGAKAAGGDLRFEVGVAGAEQAHVGAGGAAVAHPLEDAVLEHAEYLGLRHRGQGVDLVHEQGAAVGDAEAAVAVVHGAGEGAPAVAEELALEQLAGDGGAVDQHQGGAGAGAAAVDQPRQLLLAGARLAEQQHRGVGWGRQLGQPYRLAPAGTHPQRLAPGRRRAAAGPQVGQLAPHPRLLDGAVDDHGEVLGRGGLEQVFEGAGLHALDRRRHRAVAGEDDHRQAGLGAGDPAEQGQAVLARHLEVGDDDVDAGEPPVVEGGAGVRRRAHLEALAGEDGGQRFADVGLVVDHQHAAAGGHRAGSSTAAARAGAVSSASSVALVVPAPPVGAGASAVPAVSGRRTANTAPPSGRFSPPISPP